MAHGNLGAEIDKFHAGIYKPEETISAGSAYPPGV